MQPLPFLPKSRDEFPHLLNAMGLLGRAAEVGVQYGQNAAHIRKHWNGAELICVDPWAPYAGVDVTAEEHEAKFNEAQWRLREASVGRPGTPWTVMRMKSLDAAAMLASHGAQLDFVYLDGDHGYEAVRDDIAAWLPLVCSGGILAGHDWVIDGWHRNGEPFAAFPTYEEAKAGGAGQCGPFYVQRAVYEAFAKEDVHLTSPAEDLGWASWFIVKP